MFLDKVTRALGSDRCPREAVARGGFGEVYEGEYRGRAVAIKRLFKNRHPDDATYRKVTVFCLLSYDLMLNSTDRVS